MSNGRLPVPVRRVLADPVDDQALDRVWRRIADQRARRNARLRDWMVVVVPTLAAAMALLIYINPLQWGQPQGLSLENGTEPGVLRSTQAARRYWRFSDGSIVVAARNTRMQVTQNTSHVLAIRLETGRAHYSVQKKAQHRWTVDCGLALIEVIGTKFWAERDAHTVSVGVTEGTVEIKSALLEKGARTLAAGERLRISESPQTRTPTTTLSTTPSPAEPQTNEPARSTTPAVSEPEPVPLTWQQAAAQGDFALAATRIEAQGLRQLQAQITDADTLLQLSDVLRGAGRTAEAAQVLEDFQRRFSQDARASQMAFSLGRLYLEQLSHPARAAKIFEQLVANNPPAGLLDDTYLRWIESLVKAGDAEKAKRVAQEYMQKYPRGHRVQDIKQWVDPQ